MDLNKISVMNVAIISHDLPQFFDVDKIKNNWMDSDICQLWAIKFTFIVSKHHCRKWGRCICQKCSSNKRQLSRSDQKKYKVWDRCDFKLENLTFENTYKGVIKAQKDIQIMHEQKKRKFDREIDKSNVNFSNHD